MEVRDKHAYLRAIGIVAGVCVVLQMALSPQLSTNAGRKRKKTFVSVLHFILY